MSPNRDIHARACTRRASTNRWKKFVGNLHSMHLLATVRDRSCTRKRSGHLEGMREEEENTEEEKERRTNEEVRNAACSPERNGRGMMQATKIAIERKEKQTGRESVLKERRESAGRRETPLPSSRPLFFFSPDIPGERTGAKRRERKKRANEHTSRGWLLLLRPRHYLRTINSQNFPLESCSRLGSSPLYPPQPTRLLARPKRSVNPPCPASPPSPPPSPSSPIYFASATKPLPDHRRHSVPCI